MHKPDEKVSNASDATSAPTKGMRIPVQNLPEQWARYCREKRPDLNPSEVFEAFKDYWRAVPGKDGLKADWDATWRTWIRRQTGGTNAAPAVSMPPPTRQPTPPPRLPPLPTDAEKDAARALYRKTLSRISGYAGGDAWARRILERHAAGERLLPQQLAAARIALRDDHEIPTAVANDELDHAGSADLESEDARELRLEQEGKMLSDLPT